MAIEITNPLTIPAVEAKVADKIWITKIDISAPSTTEPVRAYFNVAPLVSSTGEIITTQKHDIFVEDVLATCATNETLTEAVNAIYAAIEVLCKQQRLFGMELDTTP